MTSAQPRGQRTWRHVERSDRHNRTRQEYSLVGELVAVVETISELIHVFISELNARRVTEFKGSEGPVYIALLRYVAVGGAGRSGRSDRLLSSLLS